jgi:hypothetical protein
MGLGVVAHLDADPAPTHLVRDGGRVKEAIDAATTYPISSRVDLSKWASFIRPVRLRENLILRNSLFSSWHKAEAFLGKCLSCLWACRGQSPPPNDYVIAY